MTLQDLTSRDAVLKAIAECKALGRSTFLMKYGYRRALRYFLSYEGELYDSKAIIGVAYGFQYPERGPLTRKEFSGGEATVKAKLQALGFTVEVREDGEPDEPDNSDLGLQPAPRLDVNRTYTWAELEELFDFEPGYLGSAGGMVSRPDVNSLLLITHIGGAKSFDYEDYWDGNDLIYTGRGKVGDQKLAGQNKQLAENSRTNFVFEYAGPRQLRFRGIAQCVQHWWARGKDDNGDMRKILRFRLRFTESAVGSTERLARVDAVKRPARPRPLRTPRPFDPTLVPAPFKPGTQRASQEETLALSEKALHDHHALLAALHDALQATGWTSIEEIPGSVDLWARSPTEGQRVIFEAKTVSESNEAHQSRDALAQLLEYRHFDGVPDDRLCLVTNAPLSDARERFLRAHGVAVVTYDGSTFHAAGPLAGEWLGELVRGAQG